MTSVGEVPVPQLYCTRYFTVTGEKKRQRSGGEWRHLIGRQCFRGGPLALNSDCDESVGRKYHIIRQFIIQYKNQPHQQFNTQNLKPPARRERKGGKKKERYYFNCMMYLF